MVGEQLDQVTHLDQQTLMSGHDWSEAVAVKVRPSGSLILGSGTPISAAIEVPTQMNVVMQLSNSLLLVVCVDATDGIPIWQLNVGGRLVALGFPAGLPVSCLVRVQDPLP